MCKFSTGRILAAVLVAVLAISLLGCGGDNGTNPGTDPSAPSGNTFTDGRDGKRYKSVTIGCQVWMAENLNYEAENSQCYKDSPDSCAKYGRLYDWNTAAAGAFSSASNPSMVRGVCPAGWHLPSDAEWTQLIDFAGGDSIAGTRLESTAGWNDNGNGTDDYGFSALPGGFHFGVNFSGGGDLSYWWSATKGDNEFAWILGVNRYYDNVSKLCLILDYKFSVRCVRDGVTYAVTFSANGGGGASPPVQPVNAGFSITLPGGTGLTRSGYTFDGWNTTDSGTGVNYNPGSSYTPTGDAVLYAKWVQGDPPPLVTAFVDNRDGAVYGKVAIGSQVWMAENLNYNADGSKCYGEDGMIMVSPGDNRELTDSEVHENCDRYGRLYNWNTAMGGAGSSNAVPSGVQGVCPAGWHLPSSAELTRLENFVGLSNDISWSMGMRLKSTAGWKDNGNGTDDYGFSALPGGFGDGGGAFFWVGDSGYWWSATESRAHPTSAESLRMEYNIERVNRGFDAKTDMYSVRCLAD